MSRKPQPDLQVGIVHVKSERRLDKILALVSRLATNRVGVSARFDDLHDTPHALHFPALKGSSYRLKDTGIDTLPSARADNTAQ
jgi:hypothetical protein